LDFVLEIILLEALGSVTRIVIRLGSSSGFGRVDVSVDSDPVDASVIVPMITQYFQLNLPKLLVPVFLDFKVLERLDGWREREVPQEVPFPQV